MFPIAEGAVFVRCRGSSSDGGSGFGLGVSPFFFRVTGPDLVLVFRRFFFGCQSVGFLALAAVFLLLAYKGESVSKIPASILRRKRLEVASILFLRSLKRKRKRFDDEKSKATPGAGSQRHLLSACRSNNTIPASATTRHTANLLPVSSSRCYSCSGPFSGRMDRSRVSEYNFTKLTQHPERPTPMGPF